MLGRAIARESWVYFSSHAAVVSLKRCLFGVGVNEIWLISIKNYQRFLKPSIIQTGPCIIFIKGIDSRDSQLKGPAIHENDFKLVDC